MGSALLCQSNIVAAMRKALGAANVRSVKNMKKRNIPASVPVCPCCQALCRGQCVERQKSYTIQKSAAAVSPAVLEVVEGTNENGGGGHDQVRESDNIANNGPGVVVEGINALSADHRDKDGDGGAIGGDDDGRTWRLVSERLEDENVRERTPRRENGEKENADFDDPV